MTEQSILKTLKNQQLSLQALQERNKAESEEDKEAFAKLLKHMQDSGVIGFRNSLYYVLKDQGIFLAKVIVKTRNFVILKSFTDSSEIKLAGEESDSLLIGDLVYAKEFQKNTFHCIEYYKPVESLKGRYSAGHLNQAILNVDYLNQAGKNVIITANHIPEVNEGDYIKADIVNFVDNTIYVEAKEVLVKASDVGSDIAMLIANEDAPIDFPMEVINEAKAIKQSISEEEKANRTDFRDDLVVTIDGDDSHDFDDAVFAKEHINGYRLTVHIADVTHYVKRHHPLDDEAINRGTSIYVADRVVPMLPFELSNGICSLNPNEERLTLSVTMTVDKFGNVFDSKIERGIIKSHGRLTYNKVNAFFKGEECEYSQEVKDELLILKEVAKAIRTRRERRGALKLESTEVKFRLDEQGEPIEVIKEESGEAQRMIEDLMIAANCEVARLLSENTIPVLYRVHENPPADKMEIFKTYLKKLNLLGDFPKRDDITAERLNDFLGRIKDENMKSTVSYMMLRAMSKAKYSPEKIGHFGLAELDYCHFTSPIRRYPDDIIHRLVKDYLLDHKALDYEREYALLEAFGDDLTDKEIRADHIERESDDLEACKYMAKHIGETYTGKVTGMIQKGMFVETSIGIEGFVAFHNMEGDVYRCNEANFEVYAKDSETVYNIGSQIEVTVLSTDIERREINFCTGRFYEIFAKGLDDEQKVVLSMEGINYYTDEEYEKLTGKTRNKERRDMDDRNEFKPSSEQWKKVDLIRAMEAMYPEDSDKVIELLTNAGVTKEEYELLKKFAKPRERRSSDRRSPRGSFDRKPRERREGGERHSSHFSDKKRSYSDRKGRDRGFSKGGRGERRSSSRGYSKGRR